MYLLSSMNIGCLLYKYMLHCVCTICTVHGTACLYSCKLSHSFHISVSLPPPSLSLPPPLFLSLPLYFSPSLFSPPSSGELDLYPNTLIDTAIETGSPSVQFSCTVESAPVGAIKWLINGTDLPTDNRYTIQSSQVS